MPGRPAQEALKAGLRQTDEPVDKARQSSSMSEVGRCSRAVLSLRTCRDGPEDRPTSRAPPRPRSLRANHHPLLVHLLVHSNLAPSQEIRVYEYVYEYVWWDRPPSGASARSDTSRAFADASIRTRAVERDVSDRSKSIERKMNVNS